MFIRTSGDAIKRRSWEFFYCKNNSKNRLYKTVVNLLHYMKLEYRYSFQKKITMCTQTQTRCETRQFNNSMTISKRLTAVIGSYQLLVKSMHKKVLKGTKWMPRRILPMKDVEDCEKSRGAVNKLWSGNIRMGKPGTSHVVSPAPEYIGCLEGTEGTETS